jgi:Putative polyhydroxyalkanoic acid system protein (PHA_gran_rgn)
MSQPLVVTIPHRLGKAEAARRLRSGLGSARTRYGHLMQVQEETWESDRLTLRVSALGQSANGVIDVAEDNLRLEVQLPWLLAKLGETIKSVVRREGTLLLEKK